MQPVARGLGVVLAKRAPISLEPGKIAGKIWPLARLKMLTE
jgi:hypothetical protein